MQAVLSFAQHINRFGRESITDGAIIWPEQFSSEESSIVKET